MGAKWTGSAIDDRDEGDPPTVEGWRPVSDARRGTGTDADGPIAYRTTFDDPRDDESERGWLELRGAGSRVDVRLNGTRIGTVESAVAPFRAAFEPLPENELVVVPERAADGRNPADDESGRASDHELATREWNATVESRPRTFLRRLGARPRFVDGDGVIDVVLEVDAGEAVDGTITLSVRPEGFRGSALMQRVPVRATAGERVTVSKSLEIGEPAPWWPRGYGPQRRYAVHATLGGDSIAETVGFRTVERDGDDLLVNGRRVRVRGFNRRAGDPVADVGRAAEANATLVRTRGCEPPAFYEACDERGLLVWQSLAADADDAQRSADRARTLVAELERAHGHRPSLAMYGVSAPTTVGSGGSDGFEESKRPYRGLHGDGFLSRLRFRYRAWRTAVDRELTDVVAEAVAATLPEGRPLVSSVGAPGTGADATTLAPGWAYLEADSTAWLLETAGESGAFVAGVDAGSLATDGVDPADVPGLDTAALERRIGAEADAEASQAFQARTLKTVVETLRRRGATGVATAPLRDATPDGGTGVLTHDGGEKPAYRTLAQSFEPVQAVLDGPPAPGTVGLTLCNDTHRDLEATVAWRAGEAEGETAVRVGPLETADAGTAEIPRSASRIRLTTIGFGRSIVNEYRL